MNKKFNNHFGWEAPYLSAMQSCLEEGDKRETRNGVTYAKFVREMRFDLKKGFPLLTTKELNFPLIVAELLWFIEGGRNPDVTKGEVSGRMSLLRLQQIYGKPIKQMWVGDAENFKKKNKHQFEGDCGRIYGSQWRSWNTTEGLNIDQLDELITKLTSDYTGRYARVTAWNPAELHEMSLPACHTDFQCFVRKVEDTFFLSLHMNQRSCDMFLGVPFNIASYALLTHMIAQVCGYVVDELIVTLNDYHVYEAHISAVNEQLHRIVGDEIPQLWINPDIRSIDLFTMSDIKILNYQPQGRIKADVLTTSVK